MLGRISTFRVTGVRAKRAIAPLPGSRQSVPPGRLEIVTWPVMHVLDLK
jgi:hypothetical protein